MSHEQIERISDIMEFREMNDFMDDHEIERGLLKLTSILAKPDINPVHVAKHIVDCNALAAAYAVKAKYYMSIGKDEPDARDRKNFCLTMREEFHKLADSLKYLVRVNI